MAQRIVVAYYSDLSGVEIANNDAGTQFSLDGADYEIDLTSGEQSALREGLAPFVSAARAVAKPGEPRRPVPQPSAADVDRPNKVLREWAEENGFDVPARGRVPELVREAYGVAHSHQDVESVERLLDPGSTGA